MHHFAAGGDDASAGCAGVFARHDVDGSGDLTVQEVGEMLVKLGFEGRTSFNPYTKLLLLFTAGGLLPILTLSNHIVTILFL